MYSRWRLLVFNLEGVLARHCALPELVHVSAEAVATLDALSKEVGTLPPLEDLRVVYVCVCSLRLRLLLSSIK